METSELGQLKKHELEEIDRITFYLGNMMLRIRIGGKNPTLYLPTGQQVASLIGHQSDDKIYVRALDNSNVPERQRRLATLALPPKSNIKSISVCGKPSEVLISGLNDEPFGHDELNVSMYASPESLLCMVDTEVETLESYCGALYLARTAIGHLTGRTDRFMAAYSNAIKENKLETTSTSPVNPLIYARHPDTPDELRGHPLL